MFNTNIKLTNYLKAKILVLNFCVLNKKNSCSFVYFKKFFIYWYSLFSLFWVFSFYPLQEVKLLWERSKRATKLRRRKIKTRRRKPTPRRRRKVQPCRFTEVYCGKFSSCRALLNVVVCVVAAEISKLSICYKKYRNY